MTSQIDICNLAINETGGQPISSLTEDTKEARLCNDYYTLSLREILGRHNWSFATKWVTLAEDATHTILNDRYDYAFQLPTDHIKTIRMLDRDDKYEREGDLLLTNTEVTKIQYIYEETDTTKFPPLFIIAFATLLRSRIAVPLAKRGAKRTNWYQQYLFELDEATLKDNKESNEDPEYYRESDSWLAAR